MTYTDDTAVPAQPTAEELSRRHEDNTQFGDRNSQVPPVVEEDNEEDE